VPVEYFIGHAQFLLLQGHFHDSISWTDILLDSAYDEVFYEKVIHACALRQDIETLPRRDMTKLGDKGTEANSTFTSKLLIYRQDPRFLVDNDSDWYPFGPVNISQRRSFLFSIGNRSRRLRSSGSRIIGRRVQRSGWRDGGAR
jgi:hypothetical protein